MKIIRVGAMMMLAGILSAAGWAAQTSYDIGKVGGAELKIPLGARPIGMGEAFVGLADDVNAVSWNPAGLAQLGQHHLGFMHSFYLQDISLEYLAYGQSLFEGAGLGVNFMLLNFGKMDKVEDVGGLPSITGEFTPLVFTGAAGYGQWVMENLAVGGALKVISQTIDTESYSAFAVDVGALLKPGLEGLQLGLAVQNLGTSLADASLPMNAKVGAAYALPVSLAEADAWHVLLDVNLPFGDTNYTSVNLGTEYAYGDIAAVRVGYKIKNTGDLDGITGLTAGAGVQLGMLALDYALATFGDLGMTHQIMAAVSF